MNGTYLITFLCHWKNWFSSREIRLSRAIKEEGVGWPLSTCSQINIWKIVLAVMWMLNIKRVEVRWLSFNKRNWCGRVCLTDGTLSWHPPNKAILSSDRGISNTPQVLTDRLIPISYLIWAPGHSSRDGELLFLALWQKVTANYLICFSSLISKSVFKSVIGEDRSGWLVLPRWLSLNDVLIWENN